MASAKTYPLWRFKLVWCPRKGSIVWGPVIKGSTPPKWRPAVKRSECNCYQEGKCDEGEPVLPHLPCVGVEGTFVSKGRSSKKQK